MFIYVCILVFLILIYSDKNNIEHFGFFNKVKDKVVAVVTKIPAVVTKIPAVVTKIPAVVTKIPDVIKKIIPKPKSSYIPKTYPKNSYGIGIGHIPLSIMVRPLKDGVKLSKFDI